MRPTGAGNSSALPADAARQLHVLGHDRHPLGMNGTKVSVLKEANEVRLTRLLQSHNSMGLEAQVALKDLSHLTHQLLERAFAKQELSGLLVPPDLTQRHRARAIAVGLLHTTRGRSRLACSLGGQGLSRGLAASGLSCSLLRACHGGTELAISRFPILI